MHRNNKFNKDGIVYSFFYFKQIYSQPTRDLYQKFPCIFPRMCTYRMLHPFQGKLLQTTNQQSQLSQRFFAILVLFLLQTTHKLLLHLDMNGDRPNLRPVRSLSSSRASSMTFDNFIISVRQQSVTQLITFFGAFFGTYPIHRQPNWGIERWSHHLHLFRSAKASYRPFA